MGLGQIMATLLVVLPTLVFSVTFMIEYWKIMQVDYKLKLIANMSADYLNGKEDLTSVQTESDYPSFITNVSSLCPGDKNITFSSTPGTQTNIVDITVKYTTPDGVYLGKQIISTNIKTYSYHDKNISATLICPTITN